LLCGCVLRVARDLCGLRRSLPTSVSRNAIELRLIAAATAR
jgi:hypothetical protein